MAQGTEVTSSSLETTSSRVHSTCELRKFRAKDRSSEEKESKNVPVLRACAGPGSIHSILCLSACPTFSCPGIYIIEDKNVKSPAPKHLHWYIKASQAAGSSSEVPRFNDGRGRRDQDPIRSARGSQVSERNLSRTREISRLVCSLLHLLDPSRGLARVRKEIVNSTAPGAPRSGREGSARGTENRLADVSRGGSQRPSPKPPGTRALPVLCWAFGRRAQGRGWLRSSPGGQSVLAGLSISELEDETRHYRIFLRSGVSQVTHYALNLFATDPLVFPERGW